MTYWLSYGGGVNSTALAVLLCKGKLPQYQPWRAMWADTQDEADETYDYVESVFVPYLAHHGKTLEVCRPDEGVIERWERLKVTGSRILRTCTKHGKIVPLELHMDAHGQPDDEQIIGIDAGEHHRAVRQNHGERRKHYPLVDLDIDRHGCVEIIETAGLEVPPKSGCWHCPFLRVGQILQLANKRPDRMRRIIALEMVATETHGRDSKDRPRTQWGDRPATQWAARACKEKSSGPLFQEESPDLPCGCYDG